MAALTPCSASLGKVLSRAAPRRVIRLTFHFESVMRSRRVIEDVLARTANSAGEVA